MSTHCRLWPALVVLFVAGAPAVPLAARTELLRFRALDLAVPAERTYFIGDAASDEDARDFRVRLVDLGARNVNLIMPDRIIVCDMTAGASLALDMPAGFARATALDVETQAAFAYRSWSYIIDAYQTIDETGGDVFAGGTAGTAFDDVAIPISPARIGEIERNVEKGRAMRGLAPRDESALAVSQTSSLLGGSVLANFIFPESDGGIQASTEDWSDADLTAAKQGAVEAMISWQGKFPKMGLSFEIDFYERIATGYEPIMHLMRTDPDWVLDVLRSLGYGQTNDMIAEAHQFNQDKRALARTQWVVTSFIANSRNTPNNRFGGGTADYTAYAFLGGPCMLEPFPAGSDPNGVGERLVYSQIVNHEVGHLFWTLDEYPGAPGGCSSASGYLNYGNGNLTVQGPGGLLHCAGNAPLNCIMHSAARFNQDRPWCRWSEGQLGVIDANQNGQPDVFEARPRVEFIPEGPETLLTNDYVLRFRIVATAVPNRNPNLGAENRVDFALPLKRGWLSLSEASRVTLTPLDGTWDEVVEEFEFPVELAQVGISAFAVDAENEINWESEPAGKVVYFVGVNYSRTALTVKSNRIDVSWEIAGNPFNAKFKVFRLAEGEAMPGTMIRENVGPSGPNTNGFIPYLYQDLTVEPGKEYRYYVEGGFSLPYGSGTRDYKSPSKVIAQTAMIPLLEGEIMSAVAPNPSRGSVSFSVQIPRTYGGPERAPVRMATPVEISIYSVNGQLVRSLTTGGSLNDVLTLHWDGTGERGEPVPSGIYFVRALAGSSKGFQKIVLIR